MVEVEFANEVFQIDRVIGHIKAKNKKCILVFIGGMHGNEPTGAIALTKVFKEIENLDFDWQGDVYAFAGNIKALHANKRFIDVDLNRVWTPNSIEQIEQKSLDKSIAETEEQYALYDLIWPLLKEEVPIYFIDLHTTSSPSAPFITINDIIANRDYSFQFPVPTVIGIEEYISGPLLSYMNNLDTVSLAFEAGQHDDYLAVENHISFIHLAIVHCGIIDRSESPDFFKHEARLKERSGDTIGTYELKYKKPVVAGDGFLMKYGYSNFDLIEKNQLIASNNTGEILSPEKGRIFMPLYQTQGTDGFFIIKHVPTWAMSVSRILRKFNLDKLLVVLPGVNRSKEDINTLIVNKRIALFLTNDIFHLLGYRRKKEVSNKILFSRREID